MQRAAELLGINLRTSYKRRENRAAKGQITRVVAELRGADGASFGRTARRAAAPLETDGVGGTALLIDDGDMLRLASLLRHLLMHYIWRAQSGGSTGLHLSNERDQIKLRIVESPPLDCERSATRQATSPDFFRAACAGGRVRRRRGRAPRRR